MRKSNRARDIKALLAKPDIRAEIAKQAGVEPEAIQATIERFANMSPVEWQNEHRIKILVQIERRLEKAILLCSDDELHKKAAMILYLCQIIDKILLLMSKTPGFAGIFEGMVIHADEVIVREIRVTRNKPVTSGDGELPKVLECKEICDDGHLTVDQATVVEIDPEPGQVGGEGGATPVRELPGLSIPCVQPEITKEPVSPSPCSDPALSALSLPEVVPDSTLVTPSACSDPGTSIDIPDKPFVNHNHWPEPGTRAYRQRIKRMRENQLARRAAALQKEGAE